MTMMTKEASTKTTRESNPIASFSEAFEAFLPTQQFYFLRLHRSQHQLPYLSKISDSHGCGNEDYGLLVYSAMKSL
jgi:hypothetical protein